MSILATDPFAEPELTIDQLLHKEASDILDTDPRVVDDQLAINGLCIIRNQQGLQVALTGSSDQVPSIQLRTHVAYDQAGNLYEAGSSAQRADITRAVVERTAPEDNRVIYAGYLLRKLTEFRAS